MTNRTYYVKPTNNMAYLSQSDIEFLRDNKDTDIFKLFRDCSLAVLSCEDHNDDPEHLLTKFHDFDIDLVQVNSGVKIKLVNPPMKGFVRDELMKGVADSLSSVLRDILYLHTKIGGGKLSFNDKSETTNSIFKILRNADTLTSNNMNLIVCWGGHSIRRPEYEYTKKVGYELGLLDYDIGTGCGLGAMKGPMKGATIAHAKTRNKNARYIGISEPGIIASESPNPIVNKLVILPDIEKRLEAFVRMAHGIVIFPGGAGTAEEILYLIAVLMHPKNKNIHLPVILTGPYESRAYIEKIDAFIGKTLGEEARKFYHISYDEKEVASIMDKEIQKVRKYREENEESAYFNWGLEIHRELQLPFDLNYDAVKNLRISMDIPKYELACNLRRIFSAIVAGNIKPDGIKLIREHGPFEIHGDPVIMKLLDELLADFIEQGRMKLPGGSAYVPCYKVV